MPRDSLL